MSKSSLRALIYRLDELGLLAPDPFSHYKSIEHIEQLSTSTNRIFSKFISIKLYFLHDQRCFHSHLISGKRCTDFAFMLRELIKNTQKFENSGRNIWN